MNRLLQARIRIVCNSCEAVASDEMNLLQNSTNTVAMNPDAIALIEAPRGEVVRLNLREPQQTSAMEVVDAVDYHVRSAKPSKIVVTALLSALPHAASMVTIVSALASLVWRICIACCIRHRLGGTLLSCALGSSL